MARVPPKPIDFAPAWLNLSGSNKKQQKLSQPISSSAFTLSIWNNQLTNKSLGSVHRPENKSIWSGPNSRLGPTAITCESWTDSIGLGAVGVETTKNKDKLNATSLLSNDDIQNEAEFPSLGSNDSTDVTPKVQNTAWSKPPVLKPLTAELNCNPEASANKLHSANSIYKSLVPKSNVSGHKPYKRTTSIPNANRSVEAKSLSFNKNPVTSHIHASTNSQEKFSTGMLTHDGNSMLPFSVKRHRRGKNVFLRELKHDEVDGGNTEVEKNEESSTAAQLSHAEEEQIDDRSEGPGAIDNRTPNGGQQYRKSYAVDYWEAVYDDDKDNNDVVGNEGGNEGGSEAELCGQEEDRCNINVGDVQLSSSLEAEYRLLREMGWTCDRSCLSGEGTDDEPPLTDDEIREFFTRNKRNGLLGVPSISHRTTAFHDALTSWSFSSKVVRRDDRQVSSKSASDVSTPPDWADCQFFDTDSD